MTLQRRVCLFTCLLFLSVTVLPAYGREALLNGFDDCVNEALPEWEVPGLAIAIVKDDRVMLAKIETAEGKVMSTGAQGQASFYCRSNSKKLTPP